MKVTYRRLNRFVMPAGVAIAAALHEKGPGDHGITEQVIERESERIPAQPMNQQLMFVRIDCGDAIMVPLEMEAARGNGAFQSMQGGP